MDNLIPCPGCGGRTLYRSQPVDAGGSGGPDFLPGLGRFILSAKLVVVVCRDCGLARFYAEPEARKKLGEAAKWKLV